MQNETTQRKQANKPHMFRLIKLVLLSKECVPGNDHFMIFCILLSAEAMKLWALNYDMSTSKCVFFLPTGDKFGWSYVANDKCMGS